MVPSQTTPDPFVQALTLSHQGISDSLHRKMAALKKEICQPLHQCRELKSLDQFSLNYIEQLYGYGIRIRLMILENDVKPSLYEAFVDAEHEHLISLYQQELQVIGKLRQARKHSKKKDRKPRKQRFDAETTLLSFDRIDSAIEGIMAEIAEEEKVNRLASIADDLEHDAVADLQFKLTCLFESTDPQHAVDRQPSALQLKLKRQLEECCTHLAELIESWHDPDGESGANQNARRLGLLFNMQNPSDHDKADFQVQRQESYARFSKCIVHLRGVFAADAKKIMCSIKALKSVNPESSWIAKGFTYLLGKQIKLYLSALERYRDALRPSQARSPVVPTGKCSSNAKTEPQAKKDGALRALALQNITLLQGSHSTGLSSHGWVEPKVTVPKKTARAFFVSRPPGLRLPVQSQCAPSPSKGESKTAKNTAIVGRDETDSHERDPCVDKERKRAVNAASVTDMFKKHETLKQLRADLILEPGRLNRLKKINPLHIKLVLEEVSLNGMKLEGLDNDFKQDPKVIEAAVKHNGLALQFVEPYKKEGSKSKKAKKGKKSKKSKKSKKDSTMNFRTYVKIVNAAVKQNGMALQYASERLRNDDEIVKVAVQENDMALQYAATRCKMLYGRSSSYVHRF